MNFSLPSRFSILCCFLLLFLSQSCQKPRTPKDLSAEPLIPIPSTIRATGSSFLLHGYAATRISLSEDSEQMQALADYLDTYIHAATGIPLYRTSSEGVPTDGMYLEISQSREDLEQEGYELTITEDLIHLVASTPAGLFLGIQTFKQLCPVSFETGRFEQGPWEIATGKIKDTPAFEYRGAMLDVARHFFTVQDVKRYIDLIASFKMNVLHLHLTDDQGWRIDIKSWPKLATYGGSTEVGGGEGGFFTQEDYAEIVAYAESRYITIIPEIDMPGHTNAAIAAYPELECDDREYDLYTGIEVGFSSFCTRNERTYEFVEDVIRELAEITPGPYIHIGGDESLITESVDYIYFFNRVSEIVKKYDKIAIGWDEVAQSDLEVGSVVQFWDSEENVQAGIEKGYKILLSLADKTYLDMQYEKDFRLGLHWAAYIEVDDAYQWNPREIVEGMTESDILGIEAPLWSETLETMDDLEQMAFPRLAGIAELAWSPASKHDWNNYEKRLGQWHVRFEAMGINYYPSPHVSWHHE